MRFGAKAIEDAFAEYCAVTLSTPVDVIDPSRTSLTNEAEMHSMSVQRAPPNGSMMIDTSSCLTLVIFRLEPSSTST